MVIKVMFLYQSERLLMKHQPPQQPWTWRWLLLWAFGTLTCAVGWIFVYVIAEETPNAIFKGLFAFAIAIAGLIVAVVALVKGLTRQ